MFLKRNKNNFVKTVFYTDMQYLEDGQQDIKTKKIYVNQCGYDSNKSKRATATNFINGTIFNLKKVQDNNVVYTGKIHKQIADFSSFENNTNEEFYLQAENIKSYNFKVKENYIQNISIPLAIKFMEMSRQDAFDIGGNTGYGWRDSHQFSFEINSLVMMYISNPSYYENAHKNIYKVNECEYPELRTQSEPNIIWLIKFGVTRYYKWATEKNIQLHAFIKGQLAYFLFLYPHIKKYVTKDFYEKIRSFTIQQWDITTCNKTWYEEIKNHNLYLTQSTIGTVKGASPIGYAIMPNLLMYEICKRDGLEYQKFWDSAYKNCEWVISDVDLDIPQHTKGQRMNEYITMTSISYFYEKYKNLCPPKTYEKIERWADVMISRSNNMWDYRQYRTKGDITGAITTTWVNDYTGSGGLNNQPGNIVGLASSLYSTSRILNDLSKKNKLKQLAVSQLDHAFGRNPFNRHFCYTATNEFDGADLGWMKRYQGGLGNLSYCEGVLDGSPKEASYPFNLNGDSGYTEGWIAFNTAWNMSIAYLCGEDNSILDGIDIFAKRVT